MYRPRNDTDRETKAGLRAKEKERDTIQTNYSKAISPNFVAPLEGASRPTFRLESGRSCIRIC
jgi:hypothetical protein